MRRKKRGSGFGGQGEVKDGNEKWGRFEMLQASWEKKHTKSGWMKRGGTVRKRRVRWRECVCAHVRKWRALAG